MTPKLSSEIRKIVVGRERERERERERKRGRERERERTGERKTFQIISLIFVMSRVCRV